MSKYCDLTNEYISTHTAELDPHSFPKKFTHIKDEALRASLLVASCCAHRECIAFLEKAKFSIEDGLMIANNLNSTMTALLDTLNITIF